MHNDEELLVQTIEKITPDDVETYGGKATNLAHLKLKGFEIPHGFSVSSINFSNMISVVPEIYETLKILQETENFDEMIILVERVQKLIQSYKLPVDLQSEIEDHYYRLKNNRKNSTMGYAVRSSATIEDRPDVSFAGQAESCLCVDGIQDIIDAIKRVWQSIFSSAAVIYLKSKGIPISQVKMAVVVQEMISANISGVMFTANVVNNNTEEILVNATWGWGETLVSGKVIPDTYILKKSPLRVIQKNIGKKQLMSIPSSGIGKVHAILKDTPEDRQNVFALDDTKLFEIAQLGLRVEREMGSPQDIEWCIRSDGRPVILQTRPITTLKFPS